MSNVKRDLMKEIEAKVARKKQLSAQVAHQKTVSKWVAEFFAELEKIQKLTIRHSLVWLAVTRLQDQLHRIDKECCVYFSDANDPPTIEIKWSPAFIAVNNCEEALVLDASSALFQSAMEEI